MGVVTDSTAMIPEDLRHRLGITVVPARLIFGDEVYADGVDLGPDEFYQKLRESPVHPTTSQPPPGDYLQAFLDLAERAKSILCLTPASSLSGIYASAVQGRQLFREKFPHVHIEVMDTLTATAAQGLLVLEAARLAQDGLPLRPICQRVGALASRTRVFAALNTIKYLARGGRIGRAAEFLGTLLQIKPIVTLKDGFITPALRVRTRAQVAEALLGFLRQDLVSPGSTGRPHVAVMHSEAYPQAQELAAKIQADFSPAELHLLTLTPALGVHGGPGVLGLAYYIE